ncbi:MAG TPA: NAD(P)H-hydrate dehydratase [Thermotogota bacterium]|nr:NAD(P)H-hydrate dehydratase [Thermotogota bacterium]HPJ87575.1 NAD(P)H-hydrate dehydratase [Thermotogota bacterium]HPR94780.1 NAD(P)H-hydrate dehydratase [Thermotogota bacterium]
MPDEMRKCDQYSIQNIGIPSIVLMEKAAHSVCESIIRWLRHVPENVLILCGSGNNGGDGLAIARELQDLGCHCELFMILGLSGLTEDANAEMNLLSKTSCCIHSGMPDDTINFDSYEIIIDAVFGTGLNRMVPGSIDRLLKKLNESNAKRIAVDVPTGIDARTGLLFAENPFKADVTVTFAFPKTGMLYYPARDYVGQMDCTYIGINSNVPESVGWENKYLLDQTFISNIIPHRSKWGHKGTFGKLCVIGGSESYKGAPVLSMKAALKTGIGLIKGIIPKYDEPCHMYSPEMIIETDITGHHHHDLTNYEILLREAEAYDAAVIGPGLGRDESTIGFVKRFLSDYSKPVLIDADALFAVSDNSAARILRGRNTQTIMTPHMKEFSRLTGFSVERIIRDRITVLQQYSVECNATIVLKDSTTTICTPEKKIFINTMGNNGLATGGSGDVLSGMIGTFLAQGLCGEIATCIGVYIHGLTAEIYSGEKYIGSFLPSDICELIPEAVQYILK